LTAKYLRKIGVKEVLIPGIILAATLGWAGWQKMGNNIYSNKTLFPDTAMVRTVEDGDTLELFNGRRVRLIGINAPDRGERGYDEAKQRLSDEVIKERTWLEYDRYQDDQNGRILAWVWLGCTNPEFTKPDYMRLSYNRSRQGLLKNPKGCESGRLVQEDMIKSNRGVVVETYKDRGELKYEERLKLAKD